MPWCQRSAVDVPGCPSPCWLLTLVAGRASTGNFFLVAAATAGDTTGYGRNNLPTITRPPDESVGVSCGEQE